MKTKDDISKIKSLVLYILNQCGGMQEIFSIAMIMYHCQRKCLALYGRYLVNEDFHANAYGLTIPYTFKAIINKNSSGVIFSQDFLVENKQGKTFVYSKGIPDMDELTLAEIDIINETLSELKGKSDHEFCCMLKQDPAWLDAAARFEEDPTDSRISPIKMARAEGSSDDAINYLKSNLYFDSIWSS